jgi:hypothetical protein
MVYKFKNNTGRYKFEGEFNFNSLRYNYTLYLQDMVEPERSEVIQKFGNRMQKGKTCLDISEDDVTQYIDKKILSAFVIVNEVGSDETASGTLQIHDWCSGHKKQLLSNAFVWINDVCRILGPSGVKTTVSPIGALFYFMEQLTVQNIKKTDIYLFVDTHDENNKNVLTNIYSKNYGFIENSLDDTTICPSNVSKTTFIVMKKPSLISNKSSIDLSFLTKRYIGGRRKTRYIKRKQSNKNNTIKYRVKTPKSQLLR